MATTLGTLDAVLKNFYAKAVVDQLNQEVLALELFEKAKLDWSGKKVVVPVHIARNSGVDFKAEGDTLPTAGQQGYAELNIFAKFLYGRFQLTGPSISAAKGAYAFGNYVDLELKKLVQDVRTKANISTLHGNTVKGYVTDSVNFAAGAVEVCQYAGNAAQIEALRAAAVAAGDTLVCKFVRTDTYDTLAAPALSLCPEVTAVDTDNGTITLTNPGAGNAYDLRRGTTPSMAGKPWALAFFQNTVNVLVSDFSLEFSGICHNVSSPNHFGIDRSLTAGTIVGRDQLRSKAVITVATGLVDGPYNANQTITLGRMQNIVDTVNADSGKDVDTIIMNPALRQSYTGLLTGGAGATNIYKFVDQAGKGDGGFAMSGLGFNGIPIKTSKDCGKALIFFLHTAAWHLAELEKSGFADLDGAILSRMPTQDAYQGYYRMYADIYCDEPKTTGILTGVAFV